MRALVGTAGFIVVTTACGRIAFDARNDAEGGRPVRSTLVLDRFTPDGTLTDFPLPVFLDETRADLPRLSRETFRVFEGTTELAVDVESQTGAVPFVAWVRVPQITTAPVKLTLEYGGEVVSHVSPWDASYLGVWHMNQDAADSSPFARGYSQTNVAAGAGIIGGAAQYDRALESCVRVSSFDTVQLGVTTLMGWIRLRTPTTGFSQVIVTRQLDDMAVDDFILSTEYENRSFGHLAMSSGGNPTRLGTSVLSAQAWHHLAYSFDGTSSALYVDGVVEVEGPADGTPFNSARPLFIGCGRNLGATPIEQPDTDYVDGDLDEVRIEAVGRSAAWIEYTVRAHRDEVISYGPIED